MVSDPGNNKRRDVFDKRVVKCYHKRQQIQQSMSCTNSSDEDGAVAAYDEDDEDFVPNKRFRSRKTNESIKKSSSMELGSSSNIGEVELKFGFISMIGRRRVMEDAIKLAVKLANKEFVFFGAYDGYRVSHACCDRLHYLVEEELLKAERNSNNGVDWEKVMVKCFSRMDDEVMRGGYEEVGSSALVVIVGKQEIVVANSGHCRATLCNSGIAIPLSHDYKPDRPDEKKRVKAAAGKILNLNGSRVQGFLATSTSLGGHCLKPFVIPEPEVTVYKRNKLDEFIVIGTNGLWDVVSDEQTCEISRRSLDGQTRRRFPERDCAADTAALLAELAIAKGSKDNISVIVVELHDKMSDPL